MSKAWFRWKHAVVGVALTCVCTLAATAALAQGRTQAQQLRNEARDAMRQALATASLAIRKCDFELWETAAGDYTAAAGIPRGPFGVAQVPKNFPQYPQPCTPQVSAAPPVAPKAQQSVADLLKEDPYSCWDLLGAIYRASEMRHLPFMSSARVEYGLAGPMIIASDRIVYVKVPCPPQAPVTAVPPPAPRQTRAELNPFLQDQGSNLDLSVVGGHTFSSGTGKQISSTGTIGTGTIGTGTTGTGTTDTDTIGPAATGTPTTGPATAPFSPLSQALSGTQDQAPVGVLATVSTGSTLGFATYIFDYIFESGFLAGGSGRTDGVPSLGPAGAQGNASDPPKWTIPLLAGVSFPVGRPFGQDVSFKIAGGVNLNRREASFGLRETAAGPTGLPVVASDKWTSVDPALDFGVKVGVGRLGALPVSVGVDLLMDWSRSHDLSAQSPNFRTLSYTMNTGRQMDTMVLFGLSLGLVPMSAPAPTRPSIITK